MSHLRLKTTYNEEGPYGSVEKKTLYVWHNLSCDRVSFYDENGEFILAVPDTMEYHMIDAMNNALYPYERDDTGKDTLTNNLEICDYKEWKEKVEKK